MIQVIRDCQAVNMFCHMLSCAIFTDLTYAFLLQHCNMAPMIYGKLLLFHHLQVSKGTLIAFLIVQHT